MRIKIAKDSTSGGVPIPANEYWVSFHHSGGEFSLAAGGKDLKIKGIKRKVKGQGRSTTIMFYKAGGKVWSLVANLPQYGEWVALVEEV